METFNSYKIMSFFFLVLTDTSPLMVTSVIFNQSLGVSMVFSWKVSTNFCFVQEVKSCSVLGILTLTKHTSATHSHFYHLLWIVQSNEDLLHPNVPFEFTRNCFVVCFSATSCHTDNKRQIVLLEIGSLTTLKIIPRLPRLNND
jgi:hypothetical protein